MWLGGGGGGYSKKKTHSSVCGGDIYTAVDWPGVRVVCVNKVWVDRGGWGMGWLASKTRFGLMEEY